MKIQAVTIFPEYFSALDISLLGKAQENKVIDFKAVDLRDFTHDKHKTVDDSPYGGGAGMLMKPEPWGEALDELLNPDGSTVLIVPSPAGELFKQATAQELSTKEHLVFACGRYEGIEQRVFDWAKDKAQRVFWSIQATQSLPLGEDWMCLRYLEVVITLRSLNGVKSSLWRELRLLDRTF